MIPSKCSSGARDDPEPVVPVTGATIRWTADSYGDRSP